MKKYIFGLIIITTITIGCKKEFDFEQIDKTYFYISKTVETEKNTTFYFSLIPEKDDKNISFEDFDLTFKLTNTNNIELPSKPDFPVEYDKTTDKYIVKISSYFGKNKDYHLRGILNSENNKLTYVEKYHSNYNLLEKPVIDSVVYIGNNSVSIYPQNIEDAFYADIVMGKDTFPLNLSIYPYYFRITNNYTDSTQNVYDLYLTTGEENNSNTVKLVIE